MQCHELRKTGQLAASDVILAFVTAPSIGRSRRDFQLGDTSREGVRGADIESRFFINPQEAMDWVARSIFSEQVKRVAAWSVSDQLHYLLIALSVREEDCSHFS